MELSNGVKTSYKRWGVSEWDVNREWAAFAKAMRALYQAMCDNEADTVWGSIAEAARRDHKGYAESVESHRPGLVDPGPKRFYSDRTEPQKEQDRLFLDNALRNLFTGFLTRADGGDGRFLWCHVEDAYPELAEAVMEHAELGSTSEVLTRQRMECMEVR